MDNKSLRKCIICGEYKPQKSFIKITRNHYDNELIVNPNSKIFGRSAYLCYNQNCIEQAIKKKKINKALKISMSKDLKGLLDGQFKG